MAERREDLPEDATTTPRWATWFAWAWVVLVVLAAAAELLDLDRLREALDLARMF